MQPLIGWQGVINNMGEILKDIVIKEYATRNGMATAEKEAVAPLALGGMFSLAGQNPVISAVVGLRGGLASYLPAFPSRTQDPTVDIITGITDVGAFTGDDCGNFETAGKFKLCKIGNYPFGTYGLISEEINVLDANLIANEWVNQDRTVVGSPFAGSMMQPAGGIAGTYPNIVRSVYSKVLASLGFSALVRYGRELISGNPSNDVNTNSVRHMRGIELLINDNYTDQVSGQDCGRVDSLVVEHDGDCDTTLVCKIIDALAVLHARHSAMGYPGEWDGFMLINPNLYRSLVQIWPNAYYTYRNSFAAGDVNSVLNLDAYQAQRQREQMMAGSFLITDYGQLPVVQDIAVDDEELFLVNRTIGNTYTTYIEYLPLGFGDNVATLFRNLWGSEYQATDNNRFLLWKIVNNLCIKLGIVWRSRLRVDAPFLSARIEGITCTGCLESNIFPTPFPDDDNYLNGGVAGPYVGAPGTVRTITECADVGEGGGVVTFTLNGAFSCTSGGVAEVVIGSLVIPVVVTINENGTVEADFTDDTVTPAFFATVECEDLDFAGAQLRCPYQPQVVAP
jgi:hypothetical protein